MKSFELLKLTLINLAVFVALLATVEVTIRLLMPGIQPLGEDRALLVQKKYDNTYGYRAYAAGRSMGASIVTDGSGFRVDPTGSPAGESTAILLLGDSVSVGVGVEAHETFASRLERRLGSREIINASVTGYALHNYRDVLKAVLPKLDVEGVIVGLCLNDISVISQKHIVHRQYRKTWEGLSLKYPNPVVRSLKYIDQNILEFNDVFRTKSRLYLAIKHYMTDTQKNSFDYIQDLYERDGTGSRLTDALLDLKQTAAAHDKWIAFVVFPYEFQLRRQQSDARLALPQKLVRGAALDAGVRLFDLRPELGQILATAPGVDSKDLFLFDDPMHLSALGHRVVAEVIYRKLFAYSDAGLDLRRRAERNPLN